MSTKQFISLLRSHMEGDDDQFYSVVLQVAAQQVRAGNIADADALKAWVQKARDKKRADRTGPPAPIPLARPRGELQDLVESTYPKTKLDQMVLSPPIGDRLRRLVRQQRERVLLREHDQVPATHVLLVGPPGTGKTMTASALAGELHLPLFTVRLESLFSRYLGETAGKLRLLFDQVAQTRGIYLLDEFDAIGARRGDPNDVGEMRRVLNSVLAFFEEPNSTDSIVIAATNHSEILDNALARRFDEVVEYDLPETKIATTILNRRLGKFKLSSKQLTEIDGAMAGLSPGELVRAADSVIKEAILEGKTNISQEHLRTALEDRQEFRRKFHNAR